MIPRYTRQEMGQVWSDGNKFSKWLEVELAATEALAEDPACIHSAQLEPPETATTVRVDDGRTLTTDGPFVETKEALGGYCFFEADDLDAAIEVASRIPAASMGGAIEVRPLVER